MKKPSWKNLFFLAGIAAGFGLAVGLGHGAAGYGKPDQFKRFYQGISPDSFYYPPYATLENIALSRWVPGKTLVIIGGNSILNGVGQPVTELWSLRLQELLGDRYTVVNLAFRGAFPTEGGALVAEALLQRGIPVIYVANTSPGTCGLPVGNTYEYLYWDALYSGKLTAYPARAVAIAARTQTLGSEALGKQRELQRASWLNHWLHFQDLWHHLSYRYAFTVWSPILRLQPWLPRDLVVDRESKPEPLILRFHTGLAQEMAIVRGFSQNNLLPDGARGWVSDPARQRPLDQSIEAAFVPALRPRTLMILAQNCPFYRDQLTPAELARDVAAFAITEKIWAAHGIRCRTIGEEFTAEDYRDRCHLAPIGGYKLAAAVAAEIGKMKPSAP